MHTFENIELSFEERARDLVSRMTLEEKISQMVHEAPAIDRLGVPEYNWWNECLHGVARAGTATVFPQAIGLAATWNPDLLFQVATAISDEARAKHHDALRRGNLGQYFGLTFWSPNINIFRDPRWGRGHETYGEDPYLTSRLGVAFVRGLQGDDPKYLKLVATPKHYAVHSGPEIERHEFDAVVSEKDLWETYLPAFQACVREAGAASVMGAYNRTNGEPCCGSPRLLQTILRGEWGFDGYVVSDCGAIDDFHQHHHVTDTAAESAAIAVGNGCDLNCGATYNYLLDAVHQGLISEAIIDRSVTRLMHARFRLGMFDPPESVPFASIPPEVNDCAQHRSLALQAARESIVLLKNEGGLLPLSRNLRSILIAGPNAGSLDVLLGNYNGLNGQLTTILEGISGKVSPGTAVNWVEGCKLVGSDRSGFGYARYLASQSDIIIAVLGLSPRLEGEEGETGDEAPGGDRRHINLPGVQEEFLKELHATGKPVVLVLTNGSALAIPGAQQNIPAILEAWYPGEEGGTAVADVLFGDYNPAGRLPVTFYRSLDDVPDFRDYRMQNRTYRFFRGEPLYPFGYGLSYTTFSYSGMVISGGKPSDGESVEVSVKVSNIGDRAGDEVVQLYLSHANPAPGDPIRQLKGFIRLPLEPGETREITFLLPPEQFAAVGEDGRATIRPGKAVITVGGGQPIPVGSYTPPYAQGEVLV